MMGTFEGKIIANASGYGFLALTVYLMKKHTPYIQQFKTGSRFIFFMIYNVWAQILGGTIPMGSTILTPLIEHIEKDIGSGQYLALMTMVNLIE